MIAVLDYGSQFAHLIARRIRSLGVYAEIFPNTTPSSVLKNKKVEGIILSGGPRSVYENNAPTIDKRIFTLGVPVLGLCYGHQLLAHTLGGKVVPSSKEYGKETLTVAGKSRLLQGLGKKEQVWMSHGDSVVALPQGFSVSGSTQECKIAAFADEKRRTYGLQFHPEVQHTLHGMKILENFIKICGCKRNYTIKGLDRKLVAEIKAKVGNGAVIMGVSGGVDSLVASALIKTATPNIYCAFVDHGIIRKGEAAYVKELYEKLGFRHYYYADASQIFYTRLKGITDPEEKRRVIGKTFIEVFEAKVKELKAKHGEIRFLGQGTIYPDRIESAKASKAADVIKTHHNVGGLPAKMRLKLVEPLKDLYKDEVRELGKMIGLPLDALMRHPFPGPGLAVRIVGEITAERIGIVQEADFIFTDELKKTGQYDKIWQAFAALLPVKAVGVMGDSRSYGYIISLRAVTSVDGMTADWAKIPNDVLERAASRIVKNVRGVTRVVYDITQKPPATIEYE
ncbi:glutamine-hydrolyzing GMP synthase [Candidatus Woesearchaeota archaeon]|nr:glutamine-hydrolyzing GMP synthase [Candidatus Woesearchaeota archaeon]